MNLRIKERWNSFWARQAEIARGREERLMSVNCPYCEYHYTKTETYKHEQETEIENLTTIKCCNCDSVFAIKSKVYYELGPVHIKTAVELWKDPNFLTKNAVS